MREIKYRGRRKDNGELVYGYYHACIGKGDMRSYEWGRQGGRKVNTRTVDFNSHWILESTKPDEQSWTVADTYTSWEVDLETVGAFTGLKDKSGVECYEKDFIKTET